MPGTDPIEATRIVRGELGEPNLPHLVQLPDRGVGSDDTGRTAAMLEGLYVDVQPFGWRIVDRPGQDHRRAVSALTTDLNVLADVVGAEENPGGTLKIQLRGPLSMATGLYLHHGERALSDPGARRDVAESLAVGAAGHVRDVIRTSGRRDVTVVVEEPGLSDVLGGTVPTASGYRTLRAVPRNEVTRTWATLVDSLLGAGAAAVVLAPEARAADINTVFDAVAASGADGVSLSIGSLDRVGWERAAGLVEAEQQLWLGLLDPSKEPPSVVRAVERILRPWRQLGLVDAALGTLTLLPTGGLAEATPEAVRAVLARLTQTADAMNQVLAEA
jgi:hypothetical protein